MTYKDDQKAPSVESSVAKAEELEFPVALPIGYHLHTCSFRDIQAVYVITTTIAHNKD